MKPAAIQGCYADYRRVKGRAVLQLIIEVPIEQAPLVHQAFGEPDPQGSTWVAVARLQKATEKHQPDVPSDAPRAARRFSDLPPAQQAGIICNEPVFAAFLREEMEHPNADPAMFVRWYCNVKSRSDITADNPRWIDLRTKYLSWKALENA